MDPVLIHVPAQALSFVVSTQYSYDPAPLLAAQESVRLVCWFFALFFGDDLLNAPGSAPAATVIDNARCATCCGELLSVTCAVNDAVSGVVGVPEMRPVPAFSARPAGRLPATMLQV